MSIPVGNPDRPREAIAREDPVCVYVVVNGSLGMGLGKTVAQTLQLAVWLGRAADDERRAALEGWIDEGCRTVARVAETASVFARVRDEADGIVLADEGLTEVAAGEETMWASWPVRRSLAPKILAHKRVPLL